MLNETHDTSLNSWVESANNDSDFPIQNLPFAVFRRSGSDETYRGGVAIGDQVLDLAAVANLSVFSGAVQQACEMASQETLNDFMALGQTLNSKFRLALSRALRSGSPQKQLLQSCLISQNAVEFELPCRIGDYTDFYSSIYHASAVGKLFRPDQPLLPNYQWVPIAYHGRASSINISGKNFHRPYGQIKSHGGDAPELAPTKRLDYELELGIYIGQNSNQGERIDIEHAEQHIFGMCLFNDWSARDIQAWEYQPLGPFLGKNFASTISPWIVTLEALAPFRVEFKRDNTDPQPLEYLSCNSNSKSGGIDIQLDCLIETVQMRQENQAPTTISTTNFKHCYWTPAQMVTHHSLSGCNLKSGDLFGTGTQSGPVKEEAGSLLELTEGGNKRIGLANGEQRTFLEDGDVVIMRAHCTKPGMTKIGFGEVVAQVLPAVVGKD